MRVALRVGLIGVHHVVQVYAHAPHNLVLPGHLRAVLHQRHTRKRGRGGRVNAERGKRLAVHREHDVVARAAHIPFEREEPVVQRRKLRPLRRQRGDDGNGTGYGIAVLVVATRDHIRTDDLRGGRINQVFRSEVVREEMVVAIDVDGERAAFFSARHVVNAPGYIDAHVGPVGQMFALRNILPRAARLLLQRYAVKLQPIGEVGYARLGCGSVGGRLGVFRESGHMKRERA